MKDKKIESNHMLPKNSTQIITCEQTGHHSYIIEV